MLLTVVLEFGTYSSRAAQVLSILTGTFLGNASGVSWSFLLCKFMTYLGRVCNSLTHLPSQESHTWVIVLFVGKKVRFHIAKLIACTAFAAITCFCLYCTKRSQNDTKMIRCFILPITFATSLVILLLGYSSLQVIYFVSMVLDTAALFCQTYKDHQ